jgi:hypothetical protein
MVDSIENRVKKRHKVWANSKLSSQRTKEQEAGTNDSLFAPKQRKDRQINVRCLDLGA